MNKTILFISIIGLIIFSNPAINYWLIVFRDTFFKDGKTLAIYTFFESAFNACILFIIYYLFMNHTVFDPSFILFFMFSHGALFTIIMFFLPIMYGLNWFSNTVVKSAVRKLSEIKIVHILSQHISKNIIVVWICIHLKEYYSDNLKLSENYLLSGKWSRLILTIDYMLSGIITASNISNDLISKWIKEIYQKQVAFQTVYKNDLQLYTEIFLVSFLSFVLSNKHVENL